MDNLMFPFIPFKTTPEEIEHLKVIIEEMKVVGIDERFISYASEYARIDQGMFDLIDLWSQEQNSVEKQNILNDIQQGIDDLNSYFFD